MELQATQIAQALFAKHSNVSVTDALLDDLAFQYASEMLDEDEGEAFVERMAEDEYKAVMRQIFCRCAMGVNAALMIKEQGVFEAFARLLEFPDLSADDDQLAKLTRYTLQKLGEDAAEAADDEAGLKARVDRMIAQV